MQKLMLTITLMMAAFLFVAIPARAHHGEAQYDATKLVTVKGTISDIQFVNPHVIIVLEAMDQSGAVRQWIGEAASPNMLVREGFDKNAVKVGDSIIVTGYPAKKGNKVMLKKMIFSNGQKFSARPYWGS